jgi:hypothetical protein
MTPVRWFCALFGIAFGLAIVGLIVWDIVLYSNGQQTISRWIFNESTAFPEIPASLGLFTGYLVGCLSGHFFFGLRSEVQAPAPARTRISAFAPRSFFVSSQHGPNEDLRAASNGTGLRP